MLRWLKNKIKPPKNLIFKSNEAAFIYASKYMQRPLIQGSIIFGHVIGKIAPRSKLLKTTQERWKVSLATEHGALESENCGSIFTEIMKDLGQDSSPIQIGDLVAVEAASYDPRHPVGSPMQYFIITLKLKPELKLHDHIFIPDTTAR